MARRQKKYHYIYKTTCTVNGKYYIGMHSTEKEAFIEIWRLPENWNP